MEHTATNLSKQLLLFREAREGSHQTCRSRTRLTTNPTHAAQRPTVRRKPEPGASPWGRKGVFEHHIGCLQPLVHTPEGQSPETPSWENPRDSCWTHLHPWVLASKPPADAAAAPGLWVGKVHLLLLDLPPRGMISSEGKWFFTHLRASWGASRNRLEGAMFSSPPSALGAPASPEKPGHVHLQLAFYPWCPGFCNHRPWHASRLPGAGGQQNFY